MVRVVFSRRWLKWHLLLIAGCAVLILLGRWQWGRARSAQGTLQNLGYAFEWWLFACLAVYGWWRELRADVRLARAGKLDRPAADPESAVSALGLPRSAATPVEEPDEELEAYNRYLAQLNSRYERQRRPVSHER